MNNIILETQDFKDKTIIKVFRVREDKDMLARDHVKTIIIFDNLDVKVFKV